MNQDRDETKWTLWWIAGDRQSCLFFGNFDTAEEAEAAIPAAKAEFLSQCPDDYEEHPDASWNIQPPTEDD